MFWPLVDWGNLKIWVFFWKFEDFSGNLRIFSEKLEIADHRLWRLRARVPGLRLYSLLQRKCSAHILATQRAYRLRLFWTSSWMLKLHYKSWMRKMQFNFCNELQRLYTYARFLVDAVYFLDDVKYPRLS